MPRKTRRQRLMGLLERDAFDVEELAETLMLQVRTVLDDLEHVRHSAGDDFTIVPPECRNCGFVFRKRDKIKRPSRCPECKDERIDGPWFTIET